MDRECLTCQRARRPLVEGSGRPCMGAGNRLEEVPSALARAVEAAAGAGSASVGDSTAERKREDGCCSCLSPSL